MLEEESHSILPSIQGASSRMIKNSSRRDPLGSDVASEKESYSLGEQK